MTSNETVFAGLRAGVAKVDITPKPGIQIAGDIGRYRPVEEVCDPLFAKALVLQSGDRKICILTLDLAVITAEFATVIRGRIASEMRIDVAAVMLHATQNHSAPSLGHHFVQGNQHGVENRFIPAELTWLAGGDDSYHIVAVEGAVEAARKAATNLEPVEIGTASGIESRVAFNRRFIMRDGTAQTHPPNGDPHIRYVEGPIDPEVGVVALRTSSGQMKALLLHHTCHPTHGYPTRSVSADWPGVWCRNVKEIYGEICVPLVLNGCCGNIAPSNHLVKDWGSDQERFGRYLTDTTKEILSEIRYHQDAILDWKSQSISLPWRDIDPQVFQDAHDLLTRHPQPQWLDEEKTRVAWDWVYAVALLDVQRQMQAQPSFEYEVQVFRIGEIALVALGGEPFVEGQLRIKIESPLYPTYVAHMCNGMFGYIPTREALRHGGYEVRPGSSSKLGAASLDMIVTSAGELLNEIVRS